MWYSTGDDSFDASRNIKIGANAVKFTKRAGKSNANQGTYLGSGWICIGFAVRRWIYSIAWLFRVGNWEWFEMTLHHVTLSSQQNTHIILTHGRICILKIKTSRYETNFQTIVILMLSRMIIRWHWSKQYSTSHEYISILSLSLPWRVTTGMMTIGNHGIDHLAKVALWDWCTVTCQISQDQKTRV